VGYSGTTWELRIPGFGCSSQQRLAFGTFVAFLNSTVLDGGRLGALLGCRECLIRARFVHAREEGHHVSGGGLVEGAHSGQFPVAVHFFNALASNFADGRVKQPRNTTVFTEVLEKLYEVTRSESFAPRSAAAEVVLEANIRGICEG